MLIIRKEQMDAMGEHMLARFSEANVARLREAFPAHTRELSDETLRERIRAAIPQAQAHGVIDRDDVERYLDCIALYGPDFDSTEWAGAILRDPDLMGSEKIDRLNYHVLLVLKERR